VCFNKFDLIDLRVLHCCDLFICCVASLFTISWNTLHIRLFTLNQFWVYLVLLTFCSVGGPCLLAKLSCVLIEQAQTPFGSDRIVVNSELAVITDYRGHVNSSCICVYLLSPA